MAASSILVIGDNAHFCYLMKRYIRKSAHRSLLIHPGPGAYTAIHQEKPAAIILEIALPGNEGWEILHSLKTDPATCHIPVVICSWRDEIKLSQIEEANAFLHMPILYEEFLKALVAIGLCPLKGS